MLGDAQVGVLLTDHRHSGLVPAGGATFVDFKVDYPGKYTLVDHALSRAGKGLAGVLEVKGKADATVYKATHQGNGDMAH